MIIHFREMPRLILALILMVFVASAADVSGKWKGTSESGTEIVLQLKADDANLAGTVSLNGTEKPISDGKITKDQLTFSMPSLYGNGTVAVTGRLAGDELTLTLETPVGPIKATLKRQ